MAKKKKKTEEKVKKPVTIAVKEPEYVSLIERVARETEEWGKGGRGKKREIAKMAFALWLTIPVRYRGAPEAVVRTLGISDPDVLELVGVKNTVEFSETFKIGRQALTEWRAEIESRQVDPLADARPFFVKLMREGLAALYMKLIENGDAERFKVFASFVAGWVPMSGVQHSGDVKIEMSEERRKQLKKILGDNDY